MNETWSTQQERGNRFMLNLLLWSSLVVGRTFMTVVAIPIVFYFVATSAKARQASRDYLRRVVPDKIGLRQIFKHFYTFAIVSIDRLYVLSGRTGSITTTFHGREIIEPLLTNPNGALFFVAHLGSFEVLRAASKHRIENVINILMDRQHNQRIMEVFEKLDPELAARVIDVKQDAVELAMTLQARLQRRELVGIMADRTLPGEDHVQCNFLGQPAFFPLSPWRLAIVLQVPIIMCAGVYTGKGHYELHFDIISEKFAASRRERNAVIETALRKYVGNLEFFCQHYPYNWFNFYSYWSDEALNYH